MVAELLEQLFQVVDVPLRAFTFPIGLAFELSSPFSAERRGQLGSSEPEKGEKQLTTA